MDGQTVWIGHNSWSTNSIWIAIILRYSKKLQYETSRKHEDCTMRTEAVISVSERDKLLR